MIYCDRCKQKIEDKYFIMQNEGESFHLECYPQDVYNFFKEKIDEDLKANTKIYDCVYCQDTGEISHWDGVERSYNWCMNCVKGLSRHFKNHLQGISYKNSEIDKWISELIREANKHIK